MMLMSCSCQTRNDPEIRMDVSVTDSISQGFPFLPSSLSAFAPMIPRSGSFAMASSRPDGIQLRITKTNVTIGQQDLSRRCEDDGHPWSSMVIPRLFRTHPRLSDRPGTFSSRPPPPCPCPVPKRHLGGYHRFARPEVRPFPLSSFRSVTS